MSGEEERESSVVVLLDAVRTGREGAVDQLVPLVYDELHEIARRHKRRWRGDYTLNTTALLHEAYLKLVGREADADSRSHFLAVASRAMRHLLVDQARRRNAAKRGGDAQKVSLDDLLQEPEMIPVVTAEKADDVMALDAALEELAAVNLRQAQVVECRFFGGMTIEETSGALGVSPATVKLDWARARQWLYRAMYPDNPAPGTDR